MAACGQPVLCSHCLNACTLAALPRVPPGQDRCGGQIRVPGPRLRPSMAAAWVPTQSRHSSVRRHKAGSAGRRDREPRYCACCRALPARDGLVDDAPPSSGVCVDRVHRAAPSLRGGLVDIDALVRPLLCVKACADDLASESATRARGQSGFLHPRHQCDCKHGLYRPSFLVRSLGLNALVRPGRLPSVWG